MKGTIASSNAKHQVVIPGFARKALGITKPVQYYVTVTPDQKITLEPFTDVQVSQRAKNLSYLKILKQSQGAWVGDDWPEQEKEIEKREKKAAEEMRKAW